LNAHAALISAAAPAIHGELQAGADVRMMFEAICWCVSVRSVIMTISPSINS
jgi:hypothetical protein